MLMKTADRTVMSVLSGSCVWDLGSTSRQNDRNPCICGVCIIEISINLNMNSLNYVLVTDLFFHSSNSDWPGTISLLGHSARLCGCFQIPGLELGVVARF